MARLRRSTLSDSETGALPQVDDLDLRIIGTLQVDGRRSIVDISRELDVPKSTVKRRLDALIRNQVVMIAAYVDSAKLGLAIHVHLNLKLDLKYYREAIDAVAALTEVRWIAVTTGSSDLVVEGFFASPDHLHEFIRDKLAPIEGVNSVETSVILSLEKFAFHWDEIRKTADMYRHSHIPLSTPVRTFESRIKAHRDAEISEESG